MPDRRLIDRVDDVVSALLEGRDATAALGDETLAPIARIASDLRHYPRPEFLAHLRARLERRTAMTSTITATAIREGFTTVTPYLRVKGAGLLEFLSRVFDAEETYSTRDDVGFMHRQIRLGDSMIMVSEGGGPADVVPVRPVALHVYVADADATYERALAAGAVSIGAPADRPYGERSGFIQDSFGNHWYIATPLAGSRIGEGQRTVTPFLSLRDVGGHIEFLKAAFGATEEGRHEAGGRIRYAKARIGTAVLEFGETETEPMPATFYLHVKDADAVYQQALSAGATSLWPPANQVYGERMGGVQDAAGNQWFIAQPLPTA